MNGEEGRDSEREDISLLRVFAFVVDNWFWFLISALVSGALFVVVAVSSDLNYTSTASFSPEQASRLGSVTDLSSQLGIRVPGARAGESLSFYVNLLRSREILRRAVQADYTFEGTSTGSTEEANLVQFYGLSELQEEVGIKKAVDRLRSAVEVQYDRESSVVSFSVTSPQANLSEQIATKLIELTNRFNLHTRQSQARAERKFLEDRLEHAEDELRAAEEQLQTFLENNRRYENSPQLRFRYDRLQRQVSLKQTVVSSLTRSLENAKTREVRNTPVITVIEEPNKPVEPERRFVILKGLLGAFLGIVLVGIVLCVRSYWQGLDSIDPHGKRALQQAWRSFRNDVDRIISKMV